MKTLSIVIPTYNMEKYLSKCLESFAAEEIMKELEVIIVNDGSKDKSKNIALEYVKKYPDTYYLINKENGGHGSTINEGLKHATGKYFKIVDADDWVNKKVLVEFINAIRDIDIDLIITPYNTVDHVTGGRQSVSIKMSKENMGKKILIDEYIKRNRLLMHMITYKTKLLKEIGLRIDEHMFYVDIEYIHFVLPYLKECLCINSFLYQYRVNQAQQSCSIEGYLKHRTEHAKVILHCLKYRRKRKDKYQSKRVYQYAYKQLYELTDVQYRIYLSDLKNINSGKEAHSFDVALMKQSQELYKEMNSLEYIRKLRESNFKNMIIQQLYFRYMQKKGKYKEIGMN